MEAKRTVALLIGLFAVFPCFADIIAVKSDGTGDYATIQAAIDAADTGDVIELWSGTYSGAGNRDIDFKGLAITVRSTEPNNPVIVDSTIINCGGTELEPHRGFYFHSGEEANSVLAGVTITNGFGPEEELYNCLGGTYTDSAGGGIFCEGSSPSIIGCKIISNEADYGGGMCNNYECNTTVSNCIISGNTAVIGGGILNNYECSANIINCIISENNVSQLGGGIFNYCNSNPIFINCVISDNTAADEGGGMSNNWRCNPILTGCTFSNNTAGDDGGAINGFASDTKLTNCILWGNMPDEISGDWPSITYSDVQGGWAGEGNINADPLFGSDYHLTAGSPCKDSGYPNYIPISGETDTDGEPRVMGGQIDMGADEVTGVPTPIIEVLPEKMKFFTSEFGPNPQEQILEVHNVGYGVLNWEITKDCLWLEAEPNSGSTEDYNEITISVDRTGITLGSYDCELIIFDSDAANSPKKVAVNLFIHRDGEIRVPQMYETIQGAIDAASNGDEVYCCRWSI